jgi:two-component system, OmpR family, sensor histidine kinase CiaH
MAVLSKKMMKPIIQSWNKQSEFVENASHELRTPLTIIQNKLELLLTARVESVWDYRLLNGSLNSITGR